MKTLEKDTKYDQGQHLPCHEDKESIGKEMFGENLA